MLFRKSLKPPIETALALLGHAITIVYGYKHNTRYRPSKHELMMIDLFTDELWEHYCTAKHIQRSLHERAQIQDIITGKG